MAKIMKLTTRPIVIKCDLHDHWSPCNSVNCETIKVVVERWLTRSLVGFLNLCIIHVIFPQEKLQDPGRNGSLDAFFFVMLCFFGFLVFSSYPIQVVFMVFWGSYQVKEKDLLVLSRVCYWEQAKASIEVRRRKPCL